ncbi:hypothetical protein FG379_002608 [Cryptosporidium bovis]|uniref:uncharacterized protein n=1 Tax=Cryptosporidium bovis TaxID=310047 RepID=UPI00351AAF83|nr:hypothetical protein FG379_002608 [Cryptosporidium bovis]
MEFMAKVGISGIIFTVKWPYQVPEIILQYPPNLTNEFKFIRAAIPTRECFGLEASKLAPLILPTNSLLWNKASELVIESKKCQNRFLFFPSSTSSSSLLFCKCPDNKQPISSGSRYIREPKYPKKYIESFSVTLVLDASTELKYDFIEKKLSGFATKLLKSETKIGLISSEAIKVNEIIFEFFKNRNKHKRESDTKKTTTDSLAIGHTVDKIQNNLDINPIFGHDKNININKNETRFSKENGNIDYSVNLHSMQSDLENSCNDEYIIIEGERSQLAKELGFFVRKLIKDYSSYIFSLDKIEICKCCISDTNKFELNENNCDKISIIIDHEKLTDYSGNSESIQQLTKAADPHLSIKDISIELLEPLSVIIDLSKHLVSRGVAMFCEKINYERNYIVASDAVKYKMSEFKAKFYNIINWRGCNPLVTICSFFCKGNNLFIVKNEISEFLEKYSESNRNLESRIYSPYKLMNSFDDSITYETEETTKSIVSCTQRVLDNFLIKRMSPKENIVLNKIYESGTFSLFKKAFRLDSTEEWSKDEVSLITYWLLQFSALVLGSLFGTVGLKGFPVFISALLLLIFIGIIYVNYLDVPERVLDPTEVVIENTATCLVTFILSWTTLYTLVHL